MQERPFGTGFRRREVELPHGVYLGRDEEGGRYRYRMVQAPVFKDVILQSSSGLVTGSDFSITWCTSVKSRW